MGPEPMQEWTTRDGCLAGFLEGLGHTCLWHRGPLMTGMLARFPEAKPEPADLSKAGQWLHGRLPSQTPGV